MKALIVPVFLLNSSLDENLHCCGKLRTRKWKQVDESRVVLVHVWKNEQRLWASGVIKPDLGRDWAHVSRWAFALACSLSLQWLVWLQWDSYGAPLRKLGIMLMLLKGIALYDAKCIFCQLHLAEFPLHRVCHSRTQCQRLWLMTNCIHSPELSEVFGDIKCNISRCNYNSHF